MYLKVYFKRHIYEEPSCNCGTGVMQGALCDVSIFNLFQSVGVFSLDRNSVSSLRIQALVCLFDLMFYVPSTIFQLNRDWSSWVEPVLS